MGLRTRLGAIGLALGGLAPLATGVAGIWGYVTQGYYLSKTGERVDSPWGLLVSGLFILAGVGMLVYAFRLYRRRSRPEC